MKALVCSSFGPAEQLTLETVDPLPLREGEVRIDVHACGVNFPDLLILQGRYQVRPELPFFPGGEVAGTIAELGDNVTGLAIGQRVMATIFWGGMAEKATAKVESVIPVPDNLDFLTASVFQGGHLTSYYALKQRAQLHPGETLLVLGAAGGVGTAAVQLGKAMGATVIAAASSDEKCEFAAANGADETINYETQNLKDTVKAITSGRGVDVAFDPVGGEIFEQAARCMAWKGRLLVVGFASGSIPKYPVNLALLKGSSAVGVNYQGFVAHEQPQVQQNIAELLALVKAGTVQPRIDRTFPLNDAIAALNHVGSRRAMGKVVVEIREA